jgi:uncharacterized protein YdeI (YjbR/CyaY-like superfamily)
VGNQTNKQYLNNAETVRYRAVVLVWQLTPDDGKPVTIKQGNTMAKNLQNHLDTADKEALWEWAYDLTNDEREQILYAIKNARKKEGYVHHG